MWLCERLVQMAAVYKCFPERREVEKKTFSFQRGARKS